MKKGERFELLMKERGFNALRLSKISGVSYTTIKSMISRDFKNANIDNILKLTKALGIEVEDFIPEAKPQSKNVHSYKYDIRENKTDFVKEDLIDIYDKATKGYSIDTVGYFGQISAGELACVENLSEGELFEVPKAVLGKYAGREGVHIRKVHGDSMNKVLPDGSYVICVPVERHELKDGDIVIFSYNNESGMKRYKIDDEAQMVIFKPESTNDRYYDLVVPFDTTSEVVIHAKVILGVLNFI